MFAPFDPYHRWLGIPPSEQPANHYRLLVFCGSVLETERMSGMGLGPPPGDAGLA